VLLLHNRWVVLPIIAQSRRSFNATMFTCRFRIRPHGLWSHSIEILEESLALSRAIGDSWLIAFTLGKLGGLMLVHYGADARVSALLGEAVSLSRSVGHPYLIATALRISGTFALLEQDINQAYDYFAESLALCHAMGDRLFIAVNLHHLAEVTRRRGDREAANRYGAESRRIQRELGIEVRRMTALDFL